MHLTGNSTSPTKLYTLLRRKDLRVPLLVLLVSLGTTLGAWRYQVHQSTMLAQQRFDQLGTMIIEKIEASLSAYAQVLRGGVGLFNAAPDVSSQIWTRYVDTLALSNSYPGIQGVGFATLLRSDDEVAALEARVRATGRAQFTVRPEGARPLKTAIVHLEPLDWRNERALGFDMYSEPIRKTAMDRAIDTGAPSLSGKVTLVQEVAEGRRNEVQAGVLLYLPVYRQGAALDTAEGRRTALTGFVYSPFRMNDLIRGILGQQGEEQMARLEIFDGTTLEPSALLYRTEPGAAEATGPRYSYGTTRTFHGRPWTISAASRPAFETRWRSRGPEMILAAGLALSGLISWLVASLTRHQHLLRNAAQRTELALDASGTGTWILDRNSGRIELDERARTIWGLSGSGATTEAAIEAQIVPEDRDTRRKARDRALDPTSSGHYEVAYRIVAHDGVPQRWVVVRGQASRDGDQTAMSGTIRDITARKTAEEQLAISEAQLAGLVDNASDAIISIDSAQRITRFNIGAERIFGYSAAEVLGQPLNRLIPARAHPSHKRHVDTFGRDTTRSRRMGERGEIVGLRKDGTEFPAEASITRLDLPSGQVFTAILRDITDRKQFEQRLEATVAERTRELNEEIARREQAQEALSRAQRMEAFGQLAGGIAHDFNNLLTVITGNQELLEMRLKDAKDVALLKRAHDAAEMGARLTGRLLTFARQRERSQSVLDMNTVIMGMRELLDRSIGEQVTLIQTLAADLGSVQADPSEIENAILNLVINARDAMPEGGAILIETAECIVEPGGNEYGRLAPGGYVRLSVTDTGTGMPPEVITRAFEPFFTTKPQGKGTGLGLAMIYGLAQQAGGTATIYSEIGRGTTVNMYLPRVDASGQKLAPEVAKGDVPSGAGETVLLVEDNEQVRQVARERLAALGYKVLEAENGMAALDRLKTANSAIDLVFSDVVMPGKMSGYDVAEWVAINKPGIKLLLTSGYPDEMARAHGKPLINVKLLRKPYSRAELARAVHQTLGS